MAECVKNICKKGFSVFGTDFRGPIQQIITASQFKTIKNFGIKLRGVPNVQTTSCNSGPESFIGLTRVLL